MTNLKRIIDEKGVQQRRLAEQVGVTEVSMSRYVSGERIPKAPIAIRIADTLGVDVKELYGWDDAHVIGTGEDMTTEEAAEVLRNTAWLGTHDERERIEKAVQMAANALTADPEKCTENTRKTHACVLTDSQQAINLLNGLEQILDDYCELNDEGKTAFRMAITALELFGNAEQLPSAQSDSKELSFTHEALDIVSRQAAIEAIKTWGLIDGLAEGQAIEILADEEKLPSAQPQLPEWAQRVEEYRKNATSHVLNPLAFALYKVWKEYDR